MNSPVVEWLNREGLMDNFQLGCFFSLPVEWLESCSMSVWSATFGANPNAGKTCQGWPDRGRDSSGHAATRPCGR
eukprot:1178633-Prorocentrum_minimum.AAC.4